MATTGQFMTATGQFFMSLGPFHDSRGSPVAELAAAALLVTLRAAAVVVCPSPTSLSIQRALDGFDPPACSPQARTVQSRPPSAPRLPQWAVH
ncbi:hypothetical protein AWC32_02685 [Mycobacterium xenopi]|uniref:Uncharacterized protein n=1 Tax=Mycobacterium xenopi TaxID=1789 RepID=A0AAD1GYU3_MYCXE|nr:hypothetical protein AWC32_02685 [Mycobacterium xenopi]BBU21242.1 hypothetical protein MYXE_10310 [Mycobacterium xenopi]SPX78867.1 Uncharacterised protein [Mycobacterium xenopi]